MKKGVTDSITVLITKCLTKKWRKNKNKDIKDHRGKIPREFSPILS